MPKADSILLSKLRVQSFAISLDGYGAGPNQDLQNPLGVGGPELMGATSLRITRRSSY